MLHKQITIYRGDIVYSESLARLKVYPDHYIIVENGIVREVCSQLPQGYNDVLIDYRGKLIIPGFVDLHTHLSQYANLYKEHNLPLLDWLTRYTYPEEMQFADPVYAEDVYKEALAKLIWEGTTSACIWATIHPASTIKLFDLVNKSGLRALIGKVSMDLNAPVELMEAASSSVASVENFIQSVFNKSVLVKPAITPRFVPACSQRLLRDLGALAARYKVPVQSHLNENLKEIEWFRRMHPEISCYAEVYYSSGLFGHTPTLMAHCIHNTPQEEELLRDNRVWTVHCPASNANLSSGIMPVKQLISKGINVGMGTDISAGHTLSIREQIISAMAQSRTLGSALSFKEAYFLSTKGGGTFWGKVGSLEPGYSFDALVVEDNLASFTPDKRLELFVTKGDAGQILRRYVAGMEISCQFK